jgi:predicted nucleic acid-binding protein
LVVEQPCSAEVERWLGDDPEAVVWTLTPVEIVAALRRLARDGELSERAALDAEALAGEFVRRAHVVTDVEGVKTLARRLLRVHALRAADALQLGAALAWAGGHPTGLDLATFDRRLALAAEREGFRVLPAARTE